MQKAFEQFAVLNKRGLDVALGAMELAFTSAEKWTRLNVEASRALLAEAAQQAQSLSGAKSVEEFAKLGMGAANGGYERAIGYSRHCYQIASESQADATQWFKTAADDIKDGVAQAIDGLSGVASVPSKDAALAAMRSATTWTDSILEATKKAVRQTNDFTDAAISATAEVVKNASTKKN